MSYAEIARTTGMTSEGIRMIERRALRKLQRIIDKNRTLRIELRIHLRDKN